MGNTGCTDSSPCSPEPAENYASKYPSPPVPGQYVVGGQDLGGLLDLRDGGLPASYWEGKQPFSDDKPTDDTDVLDPLIHEGGAMEGFPAFDHDAIVGHADVPQLPPPPPGILDVEGSSLEPTKLGKSMDARSQAQSAASQERASNQATATPQLFPDAETSAGATCYFDIELGECPSHSSDVVGRCRKQYTFGSAARYDGEWLGGHRDGNGEQVWPDGAAYRGQWCRGRADGLGCMKHADGDVFVGEWVKGRAHGCGVYYFQDNMAVYHGQFRMDMRDGTGIELWTDGSCYKGEFRAGMKHGAGEHTWPDGTCYLGFWEANELAGAGRYTLSTGARYDGQWCGSVIHGMGTYMWADGQRYEGHYDQDRKHGFGVLFGADGDSLAGFWKAGRFVGRRAGPP